MRQPEERHPLLTVLPGRPAPSSRPRGKAGRTGGGVSTARGGSWPRRAGPSGEFSGTTTTAGGGRSQRRMLRLTHQARPSPEPALPARLAGPPEALLPALGFRLAHEDGWGFSQATSPGGKRVKIPRLQVSRGPLSVASCVQLSPCWRTWIFRRGWMPHPPRRMHKLKLDWRVSAPIPKAPLCPMEAVPSRGGQGGMREALGTGPAPFKRREDSLSQLPSPASP